jgi:propionate CoA-transferase
MQVSGCVGTGCPELLIEALRERFDATGHPRNLRVWVMAPAGDGKGRGFGRLAVKGLVSELVYSLLVMAAEFLPLIWDCHIQAWNLPGGISEGPCLIQLVLHHL